MNSNKNIAIKSKYRKTLADFISMQDCSIAIIIQLIGFHSFNEKPI